MHDLKEGRWSMVDAEAFAPGRNLALSPGKVVYRNKLIELIQYEPKGERVHSVPLLILPPWINKYYLLDLQPKNSMVRHLVEQGFTVFMVSWRNPDSSMEGTAIEDYVDLGPLAASDVMRRRHPGTGCADSVGRGPGSPRRRLPSHSRGAARHC